MYVVYENTFWKLYLLFYFYSSCKTSIQSFYLVEMGLKLHVIELAWLLHLLAES